MFVKFWFQYLTMQLRSFSCSTYIKFPDLIVVYDSGHFDPGDIWSGILIQRLLLLKWVVLQHLSRVTVCWKEYQIYLKYNHNMNIRLVEFWLSQSKLALMSYFCWPEMVMFLSVFQAFKLPGQVLPATRSVNLKWLEAVKNCANLILKSWLVFISQLLAKSS